MQYATVARVIVLIGYWLLSCLRYYKPRLVTLPNYAIFYESSIAGGVIFVTMWVVIATVKITVLDCDLARVLTHRECWIEEHYPYPFIDVLVASVVVAFIVRAIDHWINPEQKVMEKLARDRGWMENFILDALNYGYLVQVTTVRRKVYVGWIQEGPGASPNDDGRVEDIAMVPLYSGHRNRANQAVRIDSNYSSEIQETFMTKLSEEERKDDDLVNKVLGELSVVIPINEIALMRRYSRQRASAIEARSF